MTISNLVKVIKENESSHNTFIFPWGDSIIFTNGHILVRNDPNLKEYFGDFPLSKLTKDGYACNLGVESGRIKFLGERGSPDNDLAKKLLEADLTKLDLLDPNKKLEGETSGIRGYTLSKDDKIINVVTKLYFDYLSSVGYDAIGADLAKEYNPIYFIQNNKVRSVCMPRV